MTRRETAGLGVVGGAVGILLLALQGCTGPTTWTAAHREAAEEGTVPADWGPPGTEVWVLEREASDASSSPRTSPIQGFERFNFEEGSPGRKNVQSATEEPPRARGYTGRRPPPTAEDLLRGEYARDGLPKGGELRARLPGAKETVALPLKHTDVRGKVTIHVASMQVRQEYHNPYPEKIEAVYVFPLPQDAAVRDFLMKVGDRTIRGIIREREEARRIYEEARRQGYVASLMTQERPNIFTQSVANIEPGRSIDIEIAYFHALDYEDGWYELSFPMVVGPRYNPAGYRDGVGAVGQGDRGASGQATEVQYLRPETVGSNDISLEVEVDAASPIRDLRCPTHQVDVQRPSESRALVRLSPGDSIPNRDFVLRYRVDDVDISAALATHVDATGGYFTLVVRPPEDLDEIPPLPREMVFVLDRSGSMDGEPIARAKRVLRRSLERLRPDDTLQVVCFSSVAEAFAASPLPATPENVQRALAWIDRFGAGGGTEMLRGISAALDAPRDPARFRIVAFLTDGYIGNDREIIAEVSRRLNGARVFSFGVGTSVNRYLLEGMAKVGRGAVAYAGLDRNREDDVQAVDAFFRKVEHPAMADIRIDWGSLGATEVYPGQVPDLFSGRPVVLAGRFAGTSGPATLRISGNVGGRPHEISLEVDPAKGFRHDALASVWARAKIADLYTRELTSPHGFELEPEVRDVALRHGLLSAYTAFVAVDSLTRTEGDHGTSVMVPVNMPAGVRYETTVDER